MPGPDITDRPGPPLRPRPGQYLALWATLLLSLACWRSGTVWLLPVALTLVAALLHRLAAPLRARNSAADSARAARGSLPPIQHPATGATGAGN